MKPRRLLAPRDTADIFDYAVQERALAVLTVQDGGEWQTFKSRFLERDPRGRFFVLDYQSVDDRPLPKVIPGQYLGVSLRHKSRKLLFATVVEAKGRFHLDAEHTIPAIRYRWPDSVTELQRRAYYRTTVPPGMNLLVHLWPGGLRARFQAQSDTLQVVTGHLADLSCGGALVRLPQSALPGWTEQQTLGVEMQLPDERPPILLDVHFRGMRRDESGRPAAAIQFVGLELAVDGRVLLQRLASAVQRLHRLTLAAEPQQERQNHSDP